MRSAPDLVIGIPVCLAIFCFAWVIPIKRFHENVNPLITCYILISLNSELNPLRNLGPAIFNRGKNQTIAIEDALANSLESLHNHHLIALFEQ